MESSEPHAFTRNADSVHFKFNLFGMYKDVQNPFRLLLLSTSSSASSSLRIYALRLSGYRISSVPYSYQTTVPPYTYLSIYIAFRITLSGSLFECCSRHVLCQLPFTGLYPPCSFIYACTGTLFSLRLIFIALMLRHYASFYSFEETF